MDLRVGDVVLFGPPGETKARGTVLRLGAKARVRQHDRAHGQPAGTEWNVPASPEWIEPLVRAGAKPKTAPKPKRTSKRPPAPPRRSSRPPPLQRPQPQVGNKTESWAIAETRALLAKWDVPPFKVAFNNRQTRSLGQVNYRTRIISYSRPLWARATEYQKEEVVIHEVAHAVVEHKEGRVPGTSHGAAWKRQMIAMGIDRGKVSPYHTIDRTGLRRQRADTIEMSCCGNRPFRITMAKLAKARLTCRACGRPPEFTQKADEEMYKRFLASRSSPQGLRPNQICGCGKGHS